MPAPAAPVKRSRRRRGRRFPVASVRAERPPLDCRTNYFRQVEDFLGACLKPVPPVAANP